MIKSKAFIIGLLLAIITVSSITYSMHKSSMQDLIIYSTDNSASLIPASVYQAYLYKFRGNESDILALEEETGINIAFQTRDNEKRSKLFKFLIEKGIDINKLHPRTGLSPLHSAILDNNVEAVKLLLSAGSNPALKENTNGLNSLEFTQKLLKKNPDIDRHPIEDLLK